MTGTKGVMGHDNVSPLLHQFESSLNNYSFRHLPWDHAQSHCTDHKIVLMSKGKKKEQAK